MSWENLNKEENIQVEKIMSEHSIENFNGFISFNSKSKKVTIDGNLTDRELRCLAEISEFLGFRHQGQNH